MAITLITILVLLNIFLIPTGLYIIKLALLKKKIELEEERIKFDKFKYMRNSKNAQRMFYAKLISDREQSKLDIKNDIIDTIDTLIKSATEPYIKLKYTDYRKSLENNSFDTIIVPMDSKTQNEDLNYLSNLIIGGMSPSFKSNAMRYMSIDMLNTTIENMIKLYYFNVLSQLIELKTEKAHTTNQIESKKTALFDRYGNINDNVPRDVADVIRELKIRNKKELVTTIDTVASDPQRYEKYNAILSIDPDLYK